jgi:hypothetical protein
MVVMDDAQRVSVPVAVAVPVRRESAPVAVPVAVPVPVRSDPVASRCLPLGSAFGARSGDKGGNANVGVWASGPAGYAWLESQLTVERFRELLPETAPHAVRRHLFPNLHAVNFVIAGLLGEGALASSRLDPQAKGLAELLRSRSVDLPESVLAER